MWINFDNNLFGDEDYKNLIGLIWLQFDDLMINIDDIKYFKFRSILLCIVILFVKLKCVLDNKMLVMLFNMKKWQVYLYFLFELYVYEILLYII